MRKWYSLTISVNPLQRKWKKSSDISIYIGSSKNDRATTADHMRGRVWGHLESACENVENEFTVQRITWAAPNTTTAKANTKSGKGSTGAPKLIKTQQNCWKTFTGTSDLDTSEHRKHSSHLQTRSTGPMWPEDAPPVKTSAVQRTAAEFLRLSPHYLPGDRHRLKPMVSFPRRENSWWENPLKYFEGVPLEFREGPGIGLNSQHKCQPLAFPQVRVDGGRKPHQTWLTKATHQRGLGTLTGATGALWLNIESTEPSQKGDDYKDAIAALPHAYMHPLNTRKAKLEMEW